MRCPLKPGLTCARTSEMVESTPCPGCTAGRANGRYGRPETVRAELIGIVQDHRGVI